jgi:hypothetical protein
MSRTKLGFAALRTAFDSDSDDDGPSTPVAGAVASAAAGGAIASLFSLNSYNKPWVLFDDVDSSDRSRQPCRCCSVAGAFEDNEDFWTCQNTGRRWLVVDAPPDMSKPHSAERCLGDCAFHRLMTPYIARFQRASLMGISWADLLDEEQDALDSLKSAEQLAYEREKRAAAIAEAMRATELACAASHIRRVQESQAYKYAERGKIYEPCKKLYSCEKATVKGRELAVPTTLHVSSECWRYEYTDPESGKLICPHACNWLHPGEDGWQDEWDTDRTNKEAAARAKAMAAADPNQNRFANLAAGEQRGGGRGAPQRGGAAAGGSGPQRGGGGGGGGGPRGGGHGAPGRGGGGGFQKRGGGSGYGSGSGARGGW